MIGTIRFIALVAALTSCGFWFAAAGVRFKGRSLFSLSGEKSIQSALERQSLLNACAAIFAGLSAAAQALVFYLQSSN